MHARNPIPAFLIGLAIIASDADAAGSSALQAIATDSCGPSYLDIYDFQVGDVFQGAQTYSNSGGMGFSSSTLVQKYRIVSRETLAGGYRYHVVGLTRGFQTQGGLGPMVIFPTYYGTVNETWDFADSASDRRALNACQDQIARFPRWGSPYFASSIESNASSPGDLFTQVRIPAEDTAFRLSEKPHSLKIFGSTARAPAGNLYTDSALKDISYYQVWAVYAAGLGLVRLQASLFEGGDSFELNGYIRNGVLHGTVEPDSAFEAPLAIRFQPPVGRGSSGSFRSPNSGFAYRLRPSGLFRDPLGRQTRMLPGSHFR